METNASCFTLYPIQINASKSLGGGRRYSKSCCVSNPTFKEIKLTLDILKLQYKEEASKMHPKDLSERGRFRIDKLDGKKEAIKKIAETIRENREKKTQVDIKGSNFLNLVPASRKKSKKK